MLRSGSFTSTHKHRQAATGAVFVESDNSVATEGSVNLILKPIGERPEINPLSDYWPLLHAHAKPLTSPSDKGYQTLPPTRFTNNHRSTL